MFKLMFIIQLMEAINKIINYKLQKDQNKIILAQRYVPGVRQAKNIYQDIIFNDGLNRRPGLLIDQSL